MDKNYEGAESHVRRCMDSLLEARTHVTLSKELDEGSKTRMYRAIDLARQELAVGWAQTAA